MNIGEENSQGGSNRHASYKTCWKQVVFNE